MEQRKINKFQSGGNFWSWIKNATQVGAIAENPSVMNASGWRVNRNGKAIQDRQNTKPVKQLRNNLSKIGEAGITAPTLVGDVGATVSAIRHPIQTTKTVWKAGQDALWFLRNPRAVKVYHGNKRGIKFPLQQARIASATDVGIHVTPNRNIAESMDYAGKGAIMEAWIPRHNMETLDLGANDYNLLSNNVCIFHINPLHSQKKFLLKMGIEILN